MPAALVAMLFPDLFDAAEAQPRLSAGLFGRQSGADRVALGELEVRQDLAVELPFHQPAPSQCEQPVDGVTEDLHALPSTNRATSAAAFVHFSISIGRCFFPASVRA